MSGGQGKFKPGKHIIGKVYDLTQENMCAMILEIERLSGRVSQLSDEGSHYLGKWKQSDRDSARLRNALRDVKCAAVLRQDLDEVAGVVDAAIRASLEVRQDKPINLSERDATTFIEALENPPAPNQALKEAMSVTRVSADEGEEEK